MAEAALIWKRYKLLQIFYVFQLYIQPQEGAIHLLTTHQALLGPPDSAEKISQEGEVMMKCASVLPPEHLEVSAVVYLIGPRLEALAEARLHVRVDVDEFSGVQPTFTKQ